MTERSILFEAGEAVKDRLEVQLGDSGVDVVVTSCPFFSAEQIITPKICVVPWSIPNIKFQDREDSEALIEISVGLLHYNREIEKYADADVRMMERVIMALNNYPLDLKESQVYCTFEDCVWGNAYMVDKLRSKRVFESYASVVYRTILEQW